MRLRVLVPCLTLAFCGWLPFRGGPAAAVQDKPILVVHVLTVEKDAPWPYDMTAMQQQMVARLQKKLSRLNVVDDAPAGATHYYTLDGDITRREILPDTIDGHMGGVMLHDESVSFRFWVGDANGKKVHPEWSDRVQVSYDQSQKVDGELSYNNPFVNQIADRFAYRIDGLKLQ